MVRGSAEKVASYFLVVNVYKETEESKEYGKIDGNSKSRRPLQLSFVLHSGLM